MRLTHRITVDVILEEARKRKFKNPETEKLRRNVVKELEEITKVYALVWKTPSEKNTT